MTAHQFAQQLLAGPDLPIFHPSVKEYDEPEDGDLFEPVVTKQEVWNNITDQEEEALIMSYKP